MRTFWWGHSDTWTSWHVENKIVIEAFGERQKISYSKRQIKMQILSIFSALTPAPPQRSVTDLCQLGPIFRLIKTDKWQVGGSPRWVREELWVRSGRRLREGVGKWAESIYLVPSSKIEESLIVGMKRCSAVAKKGLLLSQRHAEMFIVLIHCHTTLKFPWHHTEFGWIIPRNRDVKCP